MRAYGMAQCPPFVRPSSVNIFL